ncbi:hypothetical protein EI555_003517, partial [Monodon monoceros]
ASEHIEFQVAAIEIFLKIHQTNEGQCQPALKEALEDDFCALESLNLVSQEAEGLERGVNVVTILKKNESKERLSPWMDTCKRKCEFGLLFLEKTTWIKLIDAAELNIYFKTFEEERNQMYTKLTEEDEITNALKDPMKKVHQEEKMNFHQISNLGRIYAVKIKEFSRVDGIAVYAKIWISTKYTPEFTQKYLKTSVAIVKGSLCPMKEKFMINRLGVLLTERHLVSYDSREGEASLSVIGPDPVSCSQCGPAPSVDETPPPNNFYQVNPVLMHQLLHKIKRELVLVL